MSSLTELKKESEVVVVLGQLVQVYEQVYVGKMQKLRDSVLGTRQYMQGLGDLYNELHLAYAKEVEKVMRGNERRSFFKGIKREDEVAVLLSTAERISSEINMKVFNGFWDYINAHDCKVVIMGSRGLQMYKQRGGNDKRLTFFELKNEQAIDLKDLEPVLNNLRQYRNVRLFYARYISLITQVESQSSLGERKLLNNVAKGEEKLIGQNEAEAPFLAEPGVKQLVDYFENEIFASLLKQSYSESYLAHVGSRITALESAVGKIDEKVLQLKLQQRKLLKRKKNRKQLAALAGISFWGVR